MIRKLDGLIAQTILAITYRSGVCQYAELARSQLGVTRSDFVPSSPARRTPHLVVNRGSSACANVFAARTNRHFKPYPCQLRSPRMGIDPLFGRRAAASAEAASR